MTYLLDTTRLNRWAASDGMPAVPWPGDGGTMQVSYKGTFGSAAYDAESGTAAVTTLPGAMDEPGTGTLTFGDMAGNAASADIEVVGQRYCSRDDLIAYGRLSNDGFEDEARYPAAAVNAAIQAAEEAIDAACGRSFCQRAVTVRLRAGRLCELPVVDATAISEGELVTDRQAVSDEDADAVVTYGLRPDAQVRRAAVKLAAWYLRPRAAAENARGQSIDGVFVGFELATGAEGSWTGIPEVDAFIEQRRSRRAVVM